MTNVTAATAVISTRVDRIDTRVRLTRSRSGIGSLVTRRSSGHLDVPTRPNFSWPWKGHTHARGDNLRLVSENSEFIRVESPEPGVASVTLNRPERMNSMAFDVMVPLRAVIDDLHHDNSTRVVVLTGAGRGFSSGADHKSAGSVPHVDGLTRPSYALRSMEVLDEVILGLRRLHQPVIAEIR